MQVLLGKFHEAEFFEAGAKMKEMSVTFAIRGSETIDTGVRHPTHP